MVSTSPGKRPTSSEWNEPSQFLHSADDRPALKTLPLRQVLHRRARRAFAKVIQLRNQINVPDIVASGDVQLHTVLTVQGLGSNALH